MEYLNYLLWFFPDDILNTAMQFCIAILILIVGWLVAKLISSLIWKLIGKVTIAETALMKVGVPVKMEKVWSVAKTVTFIIMMLYVLVVVFERLNLLTISSSINDVVLSLPQYIGVAVLAVFAWMLANIAKNLSMRALDKTELDAKAGAGTWKSIAHALYGFIILFFLPSILWGLGLEEIVAPVQWMLDQIIWYVPNLIGAGIILAVWIFVARLVKQILTSILKASKVDDAAKKVWLDGISISSIVGTIAYVFIIIPLAISALERLQIDAISDPATEMLGKILDILPNIIGAIALITLTYLVANFASKLVAELLKNMWFDSILDKVGLKTNTKTPLSTMVAKLIFIVFMLFAAVEAGNMLWFTIVSDIVGEFIVFGSSILGGLITIVIGLAIANMVSKTIKSTSKSKGTANLVRIAIIIFSIAIWLGQMWIAEDIINMAFGLWFGAIAVAFAVAVWIGARDVAGKEIESLMKNMKK